MLVEWNKIMFKKEKLTNDKYSKIRIYPFGKDDERHILVSYDLQLKETRFVFYTGTSSLSLAEMLKFQEAVNVALNCVEEIEKS